MSYNIIFVVNIVYIVMLFKIEQVFRLKPQEKKNKMTMLIIGNIK